MKLEDVSNAPDWLKRSPVNGVYYVKMYRAQCTPQHLCRSTGESTSKESARALGEKILTRWMGQDPKTGEAPEVKFAEAADELLEELRERVKLPLGSRERIKASTLGHAERFIGDYLRDEFGSLWLNRMSDDEKTGHWALFVKRYQREKPGQMLYTHWKHLNLVMNFAHKRGYRKDPWKTINPDPKTPEQRKLSPEEVASLVASSSGRHQVHIVMGSTMGLRLREILRQQYEYSEHSGCTGPDNFCHTDLAQRLITVCRTHGKTDNSARTIKLSPQAFSALVRLKEKRKGWSAFVFPSRTNHLMYANQNKTAWRSAKKEAGIRDGEDNCKFHLLRHFFLSEAAKAVKTGQMSVATVCKYAGLTIKVFESNYLHMDHRDTEGVSEMVRLKLGERENVIALQN